MSEFKPSRDKFDYIAEKLKVDESELEDFLPVFNDFYETVRVQHLASVMRALELYVRAKIHNESFNIVWERAEESRSKNGVGLYWGDDNSPAPAKFAVVIPKGVTDVCQIRARVAHELGHLFFVVTHPSEADNADLNHDMANVFAAFALLERTAFYKDKAPKMCRARWTQVVDDIESFCR